jgi:hypothetical protein
VGRIRYADPSPVIARSARRGALSPPCCAQGKDGLAGTSKGMRVIWSLH